MIGVIITARMSPAVKNDRPIGEPLNTDVRIGMGSTARDTASYGALILGASTRMPHRPKTTDGMPASRSMTAITTARRRVGATSVTNNAIPTEIGNAITTAIRETTAVPKM